MEMNSTAQSFLNEHWDDVLYNLIDYPSIEFIYKDFNQNFIFQLPFLDKDFIQRILEKDNI